MAISGDTHCYGRRCLNWMGGTGLCSLSDGCCHVGDSMRQITYGTKRSLYSVTIMLVCDHSLGYCPPGTKCLLLILSFYKISTAKYARPGSSEWRQNKKKTPKHCNCVTRIGDFLVETFSLADTLF